MSEPEVALDREWAQTLIHRELPVLEDQLKNAGRPQDFHMFHEYHFPASPSSPSTYKAIARRFQATPFEVAHALERTRDRLRLIIMELIRESVCSEQAALQEYLELFGDRPLETG